MTIHVPFLLGGTGGLVGQEMLSLTSSPVILERSLAIDLDARSLERWSGHKLCVGVTPDVAARYLAPEYLASEKCPATIRAIAADPELRKGWLRGTREGARGNGLLTVASVFAYGPRLDRTCGRHLARYTGRAAGADVMLHLVASEAGGAGAMLTALILDLVSLGRLPITGLVLWLLSGAYFRDATDNPEYGRWTRARQLAAEAGVRARIREVTLQTRVGLAHGININVVPVRFVGEDGAIQTLDRRAAIHELAAGLSTLMHSNINDFVSATRANDVDLCASVVNA
ncbi:MAG: hypothetical protein K8T90_12690 [Planctomycetes bacterium]|nr:hypothetical protein [Planctomycetota bacterium]